MSKSIERAFVVAWALGCCFYFMEYVVRSSPSVMIGDLSGRLGVTPLVMSSILGAYYYTYSVTSLIAGVALDRSGAKYPVSIGIGILAFGCLLFALPAWLPEEAGRLCQGAGSAFAFTGCVYLASHGFSPRSIATAIGVTQCIGMLGGSAGQFIVGPLVHNGLGVGVFWIATSVICGAIGLGLLMIIPREENTPTGQSLLGSIVTPYKIVFSNPQSWLSGIISGLLFAPTTIFAMTWGVAFFQQDAGLSYKEAVLVSSMVPMGWVIGCPLLGWLSDRLGVRKPTLTAGIIVMIASFAVLIFLPKLVPPAFSALIFGIASGAAMIPYTIIKEANPGNVKGSATGGINFITFGITALLGPLFADLYGKTLGAATDHQAHFQQAGIFFLITTTIALIVSLVVRETGHKKKIAGLIPVSLLFIVLAAGSSAHAQGGSPACADGMTIRLDSTGKKYIRFMTWATVWLRFSQANPGTAINGIAKNNWTDISLRQFRLVTYSQLSPKYLILADIGLDNQTFSSGGAPGGGNTGNGGNSFNGTLGKKPGLYVHDLWNEYAIIQDVDPVTNHRRPVSLYIGTGLHYWMGVSRMTTSGSANYLALDVPLFNWPLVDESDQFARQLGVYIKGDAGPVSYRWALDKPFTVLTSATAFPPGVSDSNYAVDNNQPGHLSTTGYAAWQFFEKESTLLPYITGTYVGTKKVLNVGAGYYYAPEATTTQTTNPATSALVRHAISLWAADVFADIPFGDQWQNWAFTGYSVYYHFDFGPGYLRDLSIMNADASPAAGYTGKVSQAGFGNLAPVIGTGDTWYTQAGILLPNTVLGGVRMQPFGEFSRQTFDRYGSSAFLFWGAGGNIYLDGHHSRISFKYQTRPLVEENRQQGSKGSFVVATQVYL